MYMFVMVVVSYLEYVCIYLWYVGLRPVVVQGYNCATVNEIGCWFDAPSRKSNILNCRFGNE